MAKTFLVAIETQKVKSYLFASPFIRETRGASLLLDMLNRKKTEELLKKEFPGAENIYLGGGSGRIEFCSREDAESFKNKLLDMYRQETENARIAVQVVEQKPGELFTDAVSRAVELCRKSKFSSFEGKSVTGGRWIRPCSSCGRQPAIKVYHEFGKHLLCYSCLKKRNEVNKLYADTKPGEGLTPRPLAPKEKLKKRYGNDFIFTTLSEYIEGELFLPQDFDDIGACSSPANYMGFIYADGDRMGEHVKKLGKKFRNDANAKEAYKLFSKITDKATRHAAIEAVLSIVGMQHKNINGKTRPYLPAEFIMAGGDDLMLVVPAHHALDVAVRFMELFQEKTKYLANENSDLSFHEVFPQGLTASAGVVIAHRQYPASELMTMAGELMKMAKKKAVDLAKQGIITSALDFIVLSEASSESPKERRDEEYTSTSASGKTIILTERPYTVLECKKRLQWIRDAQKSGAPKTKIKALYPVIFKQQMVAQYEALSIKERLKKTGNLSEDSPLNELFTELNAFPYRDKGNGIWTTPLSEIAELYDFIKP